MENFYCVTLLIRVTTFRGVPRLRRVGLFAPIFLLAQKGYPLLSLTQSFSFLHGYFALLPDGSKFTPFPSGTFACL